MKRIKTVKEFLICSKCSEEIINIIEIEKFLETSKPAVCLSCKRDSKLNDILHLIE